MKVNIDEEKLTKMKIKLLISHDQWKALKAHMYWTFMIFSFVISIALLFKVLPNYNFEVIEYSYLVSSIIIFSIIFILLSPLKFNTKLGYFIGLISIIHLFVYLSCTLLIQDKVELIQLREIVENILLLIITSTEKDLVCSYFSNNTPVGTFVFWSIYLFSLYIEKNYQNVLKTLNDFEEMEQDLRNTQNKNNKSDNKKNNDNNNDNDNKNDNKNNSKVSQKKGKSKTS